MTNMESSQSCGDWANLRPCPECTRLRDLLKRAREYVNDAEGCKSAIALSRKAALLAAIDKKLEVEG